MNRKYQNTEIRKHYVFLLVISFFLLSACEKFVQVAPPSDQVISSELFRDDKTATSTVVGLYSQAMTTNLLLLNGGVSVYAGLSADEFYNSTSNTGIDPFTANALPVNSNLVQNSIWRYGYSYIYQCNAILKGLEEATAITPATRRQLTGEARFLRALCFFHLINLFGDVPLTLSTDYRINEIMPRTGSQAVYEQIVADLKEAQALLLPAYPTAGTVRPNQYAATALLARVYLYQKNWQGAEAEASKVIVSGIYSFVPLANVFLADSKESIWSLMPVNTFNTAEGATFVPSSATVRPPYVLTTSLQNAFEANDQRKTAWVRTNTVAGVAYPYPAKYKVRNGAVKTEFNIVLRLAEQYLVRAEARAQQGNFSGANSALSDLNAIRNRAGLANSTAATQAQVISAIERERQVELFSEWGHRWLDLKRTGRIDAVLSVSKTGWKPTAALFPIPLTEIQRNPALVQNNGY